MNLLETIISKKHYLFVDNVVESWEDAIRLSSQVLIRDNIVDSRFGEEIIKTVNQYGPYIVLLPNMAMPHTTMNALGVNGTAISFMRLKKPVAFDKDDREKDAQYFFTLASTDKDLHMQNMENLFTVLTQENILDELMQVKNLEDLQLVASKIK
jgi:PTS system ascorbate-specific IIA component